VTPEQLASAMDRSEVLNLARGAIGGRDPWIVGGTVRDLLTDRPVLDVDLVVREDARAAAHELADAVNGHVFSLSDRFGAWRVIARDRSWQADITPMRDGSIEADLALRDFTVNAMAAPLVSAEELLDPHGGRADLDEKVIRVVREHAYRDDPLRTLRMARLACELGFAVDPPTRSLAAATAGEIVSVAPERVFYEFRRLLVADDVLRGIELMDSAGLVAVLLPELEEQRGVEQNPYHHLDVWGHTLAVLEALLELERDLQRVFGDHAPRMAAELERPLADDLTRGQALRLAALVHDIGKARTRRVNEEGRVLFIGHDQLGAEMVEGLCRRLRTSTELSHYLAAITRHHLHLGFLVHEQPLTRRYLYRYMRLCEPIEVEVTLLSVADRLATRGERTRQEAVDAHLELAREVMGAALEWRARGAGEPLLRGDELISELGVDPGPRVGELLELAREAQFAGEISSRQEALDLVRRSASA
jgi:putative nucleotidyltransferase with HDIG domain